MIKANNPRRNRSTTDSAMFAPGHLTYAIAPTPYFRWKRPIGRVLAAILLIPALPVIGLLVLLVRLTSRGPGIIRQVRSGKDGHPFVMYKIRSMVQNAEAKSGAKWASAKDPRVTRIGGVLRTLHLDELPQLFNVLKGEMTLMGPRPERPEIIEVLAEEIPGYLDRLSVAPGVTGLAQINLPPDSTLDDVRRKLILDCEYISTASPLMDIRMFVYTIARLLGLSGKLANRLTRLYREVKLETCTQTEPGRSVTADPVAPRPTAPAESLVASTGGNGKHRSNGRQHPAMNGNTLNALTIDVEDYFQVSSFENHIRRIEWEGFAPRVAANTRRILDLLERHGVKATFFVLGWVARRHTKLVQEIHEAGHEIGSHGYWHRLIYQQTPKEFRRDLRQSRNVLADITGNGITAYRAPSFSITNQSIWALDILAEEGFSVDSSIFPVRHDRYGIPGAKSTMHAIETPSGHIVECPPAIVRLGRWNLPVGGGGYFRLYPFGWTLRCLRGINHKRRRPFVFYIHPWEVDPEQPRLEAGSWKSRFRHRINLSSTESKFDRLLAKIRFGRLCDVIRQTGLEIDGSDGVEACEPKELAIAAQ